MSAGEAERLDQEQCWALLESARIGRIVLTENDEFEVFPVNFMVSERTVLFRTAPGTKLAAIGGHPSVAFEADEHTEHVVWSVIIWGRADRLEFDEDIERSGVLDLVSWDPEEKNNFVRITPTRLSGRRFSRR